MGISPCGVLLVLALTEGGKIRLTVEAEVTNPKFFQYLCLGVTHAHRADRKLAVLLNHARDMRMKLSVASETIEAASMIEELSRQIATIEGETK